MLLLLSIPLHEGCGRRGVRTISFLDWIVSEYEIPSSEEENSGYELTLDFDSSGRPYISYYDFFSNSLSLVTLSPGTTIGDNSWQKVKIPNTIYGTYPCLIIDDAGNINIIYSDFANNMINHLLFNAERGEWIKDEVGKFPAGYISCEYSVRGWVHVSFINLNDFSLALINIPGFRETPDFELLDDGRSYAGGVGQLLGGDLTVDLNARPHIVYYDAVNGNLKYISKTMKGDYLDEVVEWEKVLNEQVEFQQAQEVDYYVAYLTSPSSGRKKDTTLYAWEPGNNFPTPITESLWDFYKMRLDAVSMKRAIYTLFPSGTTFTITYVRSNSSPNDDGIFSAVAVDNEGIPHIAYFDYDYFDLKYARKNPETGQWIVEVVDGAQGDAVGAGADIALTEEGVPFIVYRDLWNNYLKAAVKVEGQWMSGIIYSPLNRESVVFSGANPVIKKDPFGNFGVVFREMRRERGVLKGVVKFLYISR